MPNFSPRNMPPRRTELTARPVQAEQVGQLNRFYLLGRFAVRGPKNMRYQTFVDSMLGRLSGIAKEQDLQVRVSHTERALHRCVPCVDLRHLTGNKSGAAELASVSYEDFDRQLKESRPDKARYTTIAHIVRLLSILPYPRGVEDKRLVAVGVESPALIEDSQWAVGCIKDMTVPDADLAVKDAFFLPFGQIEGTPSEMAWFAARVLPGALDNNPHLPETVILSSVQGGNPEITSGRVLHALRDLTH